MKKILIILGVVMVLVVGNFVVSNVAFGGWPLTEREAENMGTLFRQYLPVSYEDGLEMVDITRWPGTVNYRTIQTSKGEEKVTVLDGYRVVYAYPNKLPFLKIHIEQTTPQDFENDKLVIARQFHFAATQDKFFSFIKEIYNNHEYYLVGDPANRDSGTIQIGAIFFPEDSIIAIIYFFNQGEDPAQRDFETTNEYEKLRDVFIRRLIDPPSSESSSKE